MSTVETCFATSAKNTPYLCDIRSYVAVHNASASIARVCDSPRAVPLAIVHHSSCQCFEFAAIRAPFANYVLDRVDNPPAIEVAACGVAVTLRWAARACDARLAHRARLEDVSLLARR